MPQDFLTIILPVYNVERYLERCLDSLVAQRCQRMEIIAINDGSTDNSLAILQKYASRFPALRIVSQENKGLASARNAALDLAIGKYIYCVDSDDYLSPKCVETILNEMEQNELDVLFFSTHLEDHLANDIHPAAAVYYQRPRKMIDKIVEAQTFFNGCITERARVGYGYSVVVWGYAWRREHYADLRFQTRFFEDEYFTTALLLGRPQAKVKCLADRLYHHLLREGSITTTAGHVKRTLAILDTFRLLLPLAGEITDKKTFQCLMMYADMLYLDAFTHQLHGVTQVFSAHKMIRFLTASLHEHYLNSATENGLFLMLALVDKIASDTELTDDSVVKETMERLRRAIVNKRELLAIPMS